jgi:hypothetical protein
MRKLAHKKFLFALLVLAGIASALWGMQQTVLAHRQSTGPVPYRLELLDTPGWMSMSLVQELHEALTPRAKFSDKSLCRDIHRLGQVNPWVAKVQRVCRVRLASGRGLVKVRATYRQPIAQVQYGDKIYFVDKAGVVLPSDTTPKWAAKIGSAYRYYTTAEAVPLTARPLRIHYVLIQGVRTAPPAVGLAWTAKDLSSGLKLAGLISERHWANQITVVDVRNYARRISESEPELRLYAQSGQGRATDIRFGRFPFDQGGDWVISPARKLKYLDEYVAQHNGQLAGLNAYIDVRYDELRVSVN